MRFFHREVLMPYLLGKKSRFFPAPLGIQKPKRKPLLPRLHPKEKPLLPHGVGKKPRKRKSYRICLSDEEEVPEEKNVEETSEKSDGESEGCSEAKIEGKCEEELEEKSHEESAVSEGKFKRKSAGKRKKDFKEETAVSEGKYKRKIAKKLKKEESKAVVTVTVTSPVSTPSMSGMLPPLPDDLAMACLSRLKLKQRLMSRCVNQDWNKFLSSTEFYKERASIGSLEDHLCVCHVECSAYGKSLLLFVHLFNYNTRCWLTLSPLIVSKAGGFFDDYVCISHGPKLFIIGGKLSTSKRKLRYKESDQMWIYDALKGTWEEGPRMPSKRSQFSAGIIDDRLYVVDGLLSSSMDVLDFDENYNCGKWTTLPLKYGNHVLDSQGSFVKDGKLHVVKSTPQDLEFFDVYDPKLSTWSSTCPFNLCEKSFSSCGASFAVLGGRIFGIFSNFLGTDIEFDHSIKYFDECQRTWETVACYNHMQKSGFKEVEYIQLAGVGDKLFVVASGTRTGENCMSLYSVLGFKDGVENARWEVCNVRIPRPLAIEDCFVCAVSSFSI